MPQSPVNDLDFFARLRLKPDDLTAFKDMFHDLGITSVTEDTFGAVVNDRVTVQTDEQADAIAVAMYIVATRATFDCWASQAWSLLGPNQQRLSFAVRKWALAQWSRGAGRLYGFGPSPAFPSERLAIAELIATGGVGSGGSATTESATALVARSFNRGVRRSPPWI